eukprot:453226-Prymnesium_polylepis.1
MAQPLRVSPSGSRSAMGARAARASCTVCRAGLSTSLERTLASPSLCCRTMRQRATGWSRRR